MVVNADMGVLREVLGCGVRCRVETYSDWAESYPPRHFNFPCRATVWAWCSLGKAAKAGHPVMRHNYSAQLRCHETVTLSLFFTNRDIQGWRTEVPVAFDVGTLIHGKILFPRYRPWL